MPPSAIGLSSWHPGIASIVLFVVVTGRLWHRAFRQRTRSARMTDLFVACLCGALLVAAIVKVDRPARPAAATVWETAQGVQMRRGFLGGCRAGMYGRVDCRCLFEQLTSSPPGDTPTGFTMLTQSMRDAYLSRGRWSPRPEAAAALAVCRPSSYDEPVRPRTRPRRG